MRFGDELGHPRLPARCDWFWIENGELTSPVQEITIAGNVTKALANVTAGRYLSFKLGSAASPTLLISEMTVGGE
jgi:PmbA protein